MSSRPGTAAAPRLQRTRGGRSLLLLVVLSCLPSLFYEFVLVVDWLATKAAGVQLTAMGGWGNTLGLLALAAGLASPVFTLGALVALTRALKRERLPFAWRLGVFGTVGAAMVGSGHCLVNFVL